MNNCIVCGNEYNKTDRHLKCCKCRPKIKKNCIDCNIEIRGNILRCIVCRKDNKKKRQEESGKFVTLKIFLCRAKNRKKIGEICLQDLKDKWEEQSGICPYSGVDLILPSYHKSTNPIYLASLDRIDSNKLYEKGNIQFVSSAINYMKGIMSHEETLKLCKIIADKWNLK